MGIVELATGRRLTVAIAPVEHKDFRQITKKITFSTGKRNEALLAVCSHLLGK
jgi:hypothetical protein